jgi:hypothetical protein
MIVSTVGTETRSMDLQYGILMVLVLALDVWGVLSIARSDAETPAKVLWIGAIVILPVLGMLAWIVAGPRASDARL